MRHRLLASLTVLFALFACSKTPDDSTAMRKAKDDTNRAVDSARSAVVNATDAAKEQARVAGDRARDATANAVVATKEKAAEVEGRTRALTQKVKDKLDN